MGEPFRHQEGAELGGLAVIEAYNELATVRPEPLQRMRQAGGEIPKVAFFHLADLRPAQFLEHGDLATAPGHIGPPCELVSVHLPVSTARQPHGYPRTAA